MIVPVPDLEPPTAVLCWRQQPDGMTRCDRRTGHAGPHSWQVPRLRQEPEADAQGNAITGP